MSLVLILTNEKGKEDMREGKQRKKRHLNTNDPQLIAKEKLISTYVIDIKKSSI